MDVLERLKMRIQSDGGEAISDEILIDCMESAKHAILARRYPFGGAPDELPMRFLDLQFRISLDLINKIGAEGETSHTENGVSRTYQSSWISEDLLQEVVPYVKVF